MCSINADHFAQAAQVSLLEGEPHEGKADVCLFIIASSAPMSDIAGMQIPVEGMDSFVLYSCVWSGRSNQNPSQWKCPGSGSKSHLEDFWVGSICEMACQGHFTMSYFIACVLRSHQVFQLQHESIGKPKGRHCLACPEVPG